MTIQAVVTVDLDGGVSTAARGKFDQYLKGKGLNKHKLTTLWTVAFTPETTKQGAKNYLRESVDEAARLAGITRYEVLFSLSDEAPVEWSNGVAYSSLLGGLSRFS